MWPFKRKPVEPEPPRQLFWSPQNCVRRFPDGSVKQWGILSPWAGVRIDGPVDPDRLALPPSMTGEWRELDLQLEKT